MDIQPVVCGLPRSSGLQSVGRESRTGASRAGALDGSAPFVAGHAVPSPRHFHAIHLFFGLHPHFGGAQRGRSLADALFNRHLDLQLAPVRRARPRRARGGGAFHTEEFVFGTSVNHATEREKQARWPLTLLSSEVLEDAKTYGQLFLDLLSTDTLGRPFVQYLSSYASYRRQPVWPGKVVMEPAGDRVIYFVCRRLGRDEGTVLEKAQWFQAYWNQSVAPHGVFSAIEIGASPSVPTGSPTIIMRRLVAPPPRR
jgi:hypothetical protein